MDKFEPFESPLLLIANARENLRQFEIACRAFTANCKYDIFMEQDKDEVVVKARLKNDKFPGHIRVIGSSILNDMRHALDQAVCDGAIMLGPVNAKNTYFPFAKDYADFNIQLRGKCKKVRPDLLEFIKNFKPYLGGDDLLWAFNRIAGKNKHQRILAISTNNTLYTDDTMVYREGKIGINLWNERKNELEVSRTKISNIGDHDNADHMKIEFTLEIVIGEAEVIGGYPAIEVLKDILNKTEGIVLAIKAESERLTRN
ncbi:MAG TPA: hypothetical protein VMJ33_05380 [Gallionella sp.]|nr:hypothetical protein [Gallionella sp.]